MYRVSFNDTRSQKEREQKKRTKKTAACQSPLDYVFRSDDIEQRVHTHIHM
jgi:hypothetical protein